MGEWKDAVLSNFNIFSTRKQSLLQITTGWAVAANHIYWKGKAYRKINVMHRLSSILNFYNRSKLNISLIGHRKS